MLPGNHTLVVTGTANDGQAATMKVGIVISQAKVFGVAPIADERGSSSLMWLWWTVPTVAFLAFLRRCSSSGADAVATRTTRRSPPARRGPNGKHGTWGPLLRRWTPGSFGEHI